MEIEDPFCKMSPNNPFLDKFSVDFIEDDDNETVIDFDYREDNEVFDDVNQIEKVCDNNEDIEDNDKTDESMNQTDSETEIITNCVNDDLIMGSQLLTNKYRKDRQESDANDVHKKCKTDKNKEKEVRVELQMELELERQHRIQFQKRLEEHMSYSLRKEFDDCKQIKSLKLELLKCRQQLKTLKKSLKTDKNCDDFDNNSDQSNHKSEELISCSDCKSVMKSEVSMILHLINHCIEEEEFQLETQLFRLDEFTDSMIDSIRKSVSYCCPRCNLTFNCLEIYYHVYKCHTNERPIVCNSCKVFATHLDYWQNHNQCLHKGALQVVSYVDIGIYNRKTDRQSAAVSQSNGTKGYTYRPYPTHTRRTRATSSYESKSISDKSESPEVILLSDSPPHQSPVLYRPPLSTLSKPTLAGKTLTMNYPNEFQCDFPDCDFKTTSKDKLNFHTSAHTNSKFKCPYCPYVGNILNDIIRHIQKSKKHDGLKVYECRECSYGTNCLSSFKDHITHKHLDDSEEEDVTEYITDMFRNEHSTNDDKSDS